MPANNIQPENIGYAHTDFMESETTPYHHIHGILLDVKTLMEKHRKHDAKDIKSLSLII